MKVYDIQGRLKVVGFTGPTGPPGTQSVTCAELSATASLLSVAIDVVSNGLSNLTSIHNVLSNRVSANSAAATICATSAEVQAVSAQAASAIASEISNRVSADAALSAAITIVSNAASVADVHASTASAAATSADAHANTASAAATSADAHANTVSARVVSVSAELASLVQIASAAATSADTHANTASAAATSADAHANTVSARVVSVSAELASLVQIASAAATSADTHANTASAAATSADAHANTASAAATSVDGRIASLSAGFASLSARSVGNVSTHGFQSIFNALSNRISAATGGAGSVTSTELSVGLLGILQLRNDDGFDASAGQPAFIGASATSTFRVAAGLDTDAKEAIGMVTSTITAGATGSIQTRGILSLTSAQWDERTGQTGGLTIGSKYWLASAVGQLTLTPPFDAARAVGVAIAGDKMFLHFNLVDDARPYISAISARAIGDNSVHGFQSVVNALSDRISATGATVSVTSQELSVRVQVASAAATSADAHANTVSAAANTISARVVSVSAELASLVQIASAAATSADAHANTVSAAANVISARVVSVSAELASLVQIASAAATSADAHANTVSAAANTISARVVSVSAELASLVQIASAAATSADAHANAASAAATSVDARVNTVSNKVSVISTLVFTSVSARSVGDVSTKGLQSVVDALSNRISAGGGTGSVTSTEAQAISAQAASALNADNFISLENTDAVSLVYGTPVRVATNSANAMRRTGDGVWNQASAQNIGLVADPVVAVSAVGRVQIRGKMVFTSAQLRSVANGVSAFIIAARYFVNGTGTIGTGELAGDVGLAKVGTALDTRTLFLQVGAGPLDQNLSAKINTLSNQASALSTLVFTNVVALSTGGISTFGLQSVVDALSNRISGIVAGTASVTSTELSAGLASAISNAFSNDASVSAAIIVDVDARVRSTSATIKTDIASVSAAIMADVASHLASASAAIMVDVASHLTSTSALIKTDIASVSAAIMVDVASHLTSTSAVIKADIASVSAVIMADAASHLASTSTVIKADITSVSAVIKADIASVSAAIKVDINSVSAAIINEASVQFGRGQFKMLTTGAQGINTGTFTKVSGLSLSIAGSGFYEIHGQIVWSHSSPTSASTVFQFGMSMTAQPVMAAFRMMGNTGVFAAAGGLSAFCQFGGASAICATPSIMYSAKPNPGASASVANTMFFDGVIQASTAGSQLKVVVATSSGNFGCAVQPGSWIRAYKIG